VVLASLAVALGGGCGLLIGYEDATLAPLDAGTSSSGSSGGASGCEPGKAAPCYAGPEGTEGVGICKAGSKTCNAEGTAYGACAGEVTPGVETCGSPEDENCDGHDCGVWGEVFGDSETQYANSIGLDAAGNSYVTGTFYGTIPFDGNTLISAGVVSIFLVKFDPAGKHVWSKQFGGPNYLGVQSIAVDAEGSVVLGGLTQKAAISFGGADLPPGAFVAKFTTDGQHVWSKSLGGGPCVEVLAVSATNAVAFTPQGDVIVGGSFCGDMDVGDGPLSAVGGSTTDGFLAKLRGTDGSGKVADGGWARTFGDSKRQYVSGAKVDAAGSIVVSGGFYGTLDLGPGPVTSTGGSDIFLAKLFPSGATSWVRTFGGASYETPLGLTLDHLGGPALTGTFSETVDFGGGPIAAKGGSSNGFLAKYTAGNKLQWTTTFGGDAPLNGLCVSADGTGNLFMAGEFQGSLDLGSGPLATSGGTHNDIFLAKFTNAGTLTWNRRFGDGDDQQAAGIATTPQGESLIVGDVQGTVDFGLGKLTSAGTYDGFVARFSP
jgi:hypothetical protein